MTEAEWWACTEPRLMLDFLRGKGSDRKLRLFACACCRSILRFIPEGACRAAVEAALRHADGQAADEELAAARAAAITAARDAGTRSAAAWAPCEAANASAARAAAVAAVEALEQIRSAGPEA